jgi:hypothetical protein
MPRAQTLDEARKLLDPRPLDFRQNQPRQGVRAASDPDFYVEPPHQKKGGRNLPGPVENIRQRLLTGHHDTKMFLCGHVGSGKSTELNRLAAHPEILAEFSVVMLRFEDQEWATLDSSQILFRIAGAIYAQFKHLLKKKDDGELQKALKELNDRLFQATGLRATEGAIAPEFDHLVFKLRQELKLSEKARVLFRAFGETQQTLLQDALLQMVDAVETALADTEDPPRLLVLADDMDKVRGAEQQAEMFDKNLAALTTPPLRIVYTLPTGVYFGENRADVRRNVEYLYPVRVLNKASVTFKPEDAYNGDGIAFFDALVHHRVEQNLIAPSAIRLAALYAGGVLRDFFHLLREGIRLARYNKLEVLDEELMRYAVDDARLRESAGLYAPDYEALAFVHRTNGLRTEFDRRYLDTSRVLECYDGSVWFETAPLLWNLLEERASRERGGADAGEPEARREHAEHTEDEPPPRSKESAGDTPGLEPVHSLDIVGVGPAQTMHLGFSRRLNVFAGDNSAGKTFVIDVLWWALTGSWPGSPAWARPGFPRPSPPAISVACGDRKASSEYDPLNNKWPSLWRGLTSGLAIYARVDGGFSVWDPHRCVGALATGYHFAREDLWKGLTLGGVDVCNGLIADVHDWYTRRNGEYTLLQDVLTELSPPGEVMQLDDPVQLPPPDERWYPTLKLSYGPVPVVYASAAVKRVLSLAYLLVWAFQGHRRAAEETGRPTSPTLTLLIDEVEAHLHPKWQRKVLPALLRAVDRISRTLPVQVFLSTHAPLVLASLEPHFDGEQDTLLHFELERESVTVRSIPWTTHGDATNWLESNVFGLPRARSPEAESAIEAALAFRRGEPLPSFDTEDKIDAALKRTLPSDDEFFVHWFVERWRA